jgi:hypothetical protein
MIEVIKQLVDALETYGDKHRKTYLLEGAWDGEITRGDAAIEAGKQAIKELESQERNFCQRCGKRLGKRLDNIDSIHTCTPPQEKST